MRLSKACGIVHWPTERTTGANLDPPTKGEEYASGPNSEDLRFWGFPNPKFVPVEKPPLAGRIGLGGPRAIDFLFSALGATAAGTILNRAIC